MLKLKVCGMKKLIIMLVTFFALGDCMAQSDSTAFKGYLENKEYSIYIRMNFYDCDIVIPGQEIYGQMPGFIGDMKDGRKWLIVEAKPQKDKAELSISNDDGYEDLTAELCRNADGTYTLKQKEGSVLKFARNRKWMKIPKSVVFVRK